MLWARRLELSLTAWLTNAVTPLQAWPPELGVRAEHSEPPPSADLLERFSTSLKSLRRVDAAFIGALQPVEIRPQPDVERLEHSAESFAAFAQDCCVHARRRAIGEAGLDYRAVESGRRR